MGNNSTTLKPWNVKFVQVINDENLGSIEIYKSEEGKFIMKERRTFIKNTQNQDSQYHKFLNFIKNFNTSQTQDNLFVPILHTQIFQQNNLCLAYEVVDIYSQYFNFTLSDMIKNHKEMQIAQIWLCFKWMIQLIAFIEQKNWRLNEKFNLSHIFLTLRGRPAFYYNNLIDPSRAKFLSPKKQLSTKCSYEESSSQTAHVNVNYYSELIFFAALCVLQLVCMKNINSADRLTKYIVKCKEVDRILGELIESIINSQQNYNQLELTSHGILQMITYWSEQNQVTISKDIKFNKVKYSTKCQSSNSTVESTDSRRNIQPIIIKQLQGRKSKRQLLNIKLNIKQLHFQIPNKNTIKKQDGLKQSSRDSIMSILSNKKIISQNIKIDKSTNIMNFENPRKLLVEQFFSFPQRQIKNGKNFEKTGRKYQSRTKKNFIKDKENLLENSISNIDTSIRGRSSLNKSIRSEDIALKTKIKHLF